MSRSGWLRSGRFRLSTRGETGVATTLFPSHMFTEQTARVSHCRCDIDARDFLLCHLLECVVSG